jgi:ribosome-binding protein aMBF1 (putative translation factor)
VKLEGNTLPRDVVNYCELCGSVIEGRGIERLIEGTKMLVCSKCARFGEATKSAPPITTTTSVTPTRRRRKKRTTRTPTLKSRRKKVAIPSPEKFFSRYEIVEGYSTIIRKARERM